MQYLPLGNTGLTVSRLCFGALTIGPLQASLPLAEGVRVLEAALDGGVNFIDTAELYQTYPYIRQAVRRRRQRVIIASKSYAYTYEGMRQSVQKALKELDTDYIDIFLLHEQEAQTIRGHWPAVEFLMDAVAAGYVRCIGISTHSVAAVRAAAVIPEIQVIHPIFNRAGVGIKDGTPDDMLAAIQMAVDRGKGIYAMKALGGGHLLADVPAALDFVLRRPEIAAVAVGMQSTAEVECNLALFSGRPVPRALFQKLRRKKRRLLVEDWCQGCGNCVAACSAGALRLVDGRAVVDQDRCRLCGYCGASCPEMCLKII
ncbi:aldo/keto reductase [Desulfurispora thermophila]|uniref:aldo/keto reductase n=1 Tax=Desulfurispora thermophila TaxID=265470 RepID=UPI00035DD4C2|nr:aldo/keto reductase [Desulfurispora thermophila]